MPVSYEENWEFALSLKSIAAQEMEALRQAKVIGKSYQANVIVHLETMAQFLLLTPIGGSNQLAEFLGVSNVYFEFNQPLLKVVAVKAEGDPL